MDRTLVHGGRRVQPRGDGQQLRARARVYTRHGNGRVFDVSRRVGRAKNRGGVSFVSGDTLMITFIYSVLAS